MKTSIRTVATVIASILILLGWSSTAAETAPVKFISTSVVVTKATAPDPLTDVEWTLEVTSLVNVINNELMWSGFGNIYQGIFGIEDFFEQRAVLGFEVEIPPYTDENDNGIEDFFDTEMMVDNIQTEGVHASDDGDQAFHVTWIRDVGQVTGNAIIELPYFGLTFDHMFILMQYEGEFSYERNGSELQGTVALTNTWFPEELISGPLSVRVANATTLDLTATTWTATGGEMQVEDNLFDDVYGTNFVSFWLLEDGNLGTEAPDYVDWVMAIGSGDADQDGVLDLVDTGGGPVERPSLGIARTAAGFEIRVTGTSGKTYWLEYTSQVTATAWPNHHVVTLTGPTQVVTLPADINGNVFFRLREM